MEYIFSLTAVSICFTNFPALDLTTFSWYKTEACYETSRQNVTVPCEYSTFYIYLGIRFGGSGHSAPCEIIVPVRYTDCLWRNHRVIAAQNRTSDAASTGSNGRLVMTGGLVAEVVVVRVTFVVQGVGGGCWKSSMEYWNDTKLENEISILQASEWTCMKKKNPVNPA